MNACKTSMDRSNAVKTSGLKSVHSDKGGKMVLLGGLHFSHTDSAFWLLLLLNTSWQPHVVVHLKFSLIYCSGLVRRIAWVTNFFLPWLNWYIPHFRRQWGKWCYGNTWDSVMSFQVPVCQTEQPYWISHTKLRVISGRFPAHFLLIKALSISCFRSKKSFLDER